MLAVIGASARAQASPELVTTETPAPGILYSEWMDAELPVRTHVLELDLLHPDLDLVATARSQRGQTPSALAAQTGAIAVVNGDYFGASRFWPAGLARGAAATWPDTADDDLSGFVAFHRDVSSIQVDISTPSDVVAEAGAESSGIVGGRPLVVADGAAITDHDCGDVIAMPCAAAPRTAAALSADGQTLWLIVVDGWQTESHGMTAAELGDFAADQLGAERALMLDGGSASAMWLVDSVRSSPSEGVERRVANHIAVQAGPPTAGLLLGVVAERSLDGARLDGADVTLDDGRALTYQGADAWQFTVRPRFACVTATLGGYHPTTECRHVPPGGEIYASLILWPEGEVPDAGSAAGRDGGGAAGSDAGVGLPQDGGCGCGAAGPANGWKTLANLLVGLFVVALSRSRLARLVPRFRFR